MRRFNAAPGATLAVTLLLLFLSTACSKGSDSGGGGSTTAPAGGSNSAPVSKTQVIGIEGGEIVADDGSWKLTVPAFALRFPQEITITSDATAVGTVGAEYRKVSKAFKFEPHGLFFEQPANFWFKYDQGDMPEGSLQERLVAMHYVHDDSKLERTRTTVNAALNEATSAMQHFSIANGLTNRIEKVIDGTISNTNPVQNTANDLVLHFAQLADDAARQAEYLAYQTLIDAFVAKTEQILGYNPLFQAFPGIFPTGTTGGYNIIYNANGAESGTAPSDSTIYPTGNNATILGNTGSMTRAYHTFAGWNTAADGSGTLYVAGASLAIASANVVLHAQWVEDAKYTITYYANTSTGGSVPIDAGQYYAGVSVIVAANTGGLYKASNIFLGWNTQANGSGQGYAPTSPITIPSANVDLYAIWAPQFTRLHGTAAAQTRGGWHVRDSQGNIYLVANTNGNFADQTRIGSEDILLMKLNASGNLVWARHIGHAGSVHNYSNVALDSDENPWITGFTTINLHGETKAGLYDAFVIKYSKQGVRQWTRLHGVATKVTMAWQLASSGGGNMRFVGQTNGNLGGVNLIGQYDAFVTDISPDGTLGNTRHFGVTGADTNAYAVSIDSSGGTCLSGATSGNLHGQTKSGNSDSYTLRLDAAGGVSWTTLTGYADSIMVTMNTVATPTGECYTAGYVNTQRDGAQVVNWYDFILIKHGANGSVGWIQKGTNRITNSGTVHLSANGDIFLAGSTGANIHDQILTGVKDAYLMKFDASGNRLYTRLLGAGGVSVEAGGLSSDGAGGFYASGYTNGSIEGQTITGTRDIFITTKFSDIAPGQNALIYNGNAQTSGNIPTDTNVYVHGALVTTRQNTGNLQKLNFNFETWNTQADGNATGRNPGSKFSMGPSAETLYVKWRPQWTRLSGTASAYSSANGVAIDANDNVYSTGSAQNGLHGETMPGQTGYFLMKHDKLGNRAWTRLGGTANSWNATRALAVAVGSAGGSIFVTGQTQSSLDGIGSGDRSVAFLTSYSSAGNRNWTRIIGEAPAYATAVSVAADTSGGVYLLALVNGDLPGSPRVGFEDAVVLRYDQYSTHVWTRRIGLVGATVRAMHIAADGDQIYVVGRTNSNLEGNTLTGYHDAFIARLDGAGNLNWVKLLGFPASTTEFTAVARKDCASFIQVVGTTNADIPGPQMMYNRARHSLGFVRTYLTTGQALYSASSTWPLLPYHVLDASNAISARSIACHGGRAYALFDVGSAYYSYETGPMPLIGTRTVVLFSPHHYLNRRYVAFGQAGMGTYGNAGAFDSFGVYHMAGMTTGGLDGQVLAGHMDAVLSTRLSR